VNEKRERWTKRERGDGKEIDRCKGKERGGRERFRALEFLHSIISRMSKVLEISGLTGALF